MTGEQLADEVTRIAGGLGLRWWRWPDSRRVNRGWVDLVILGLGRALFVECKGPGEARRPEQTETGYRLAAAGLDYQLWRPADLESGSIGVQLERMRHL